MGRCQVKTGGSVNDTTPAFTTGVIEERTWVVKRNVIPLPIHDEMMRRNAEFTTAMLIRPMTRNPPHDKHLCNEI